MVPKKSPEGVTVGFPLDLFLDLLHWRMREGEEGVKAFLCNCGTRVAVSPFPICGDRPEEKHEGAKHYPRRVLFRP